MNLRSKEALAGGLALVAALVCAPLLYSSSPPSWATEAQFETIERSADGAATSSNASVAASSTPRGTDALAPVRASIQGTAPIENGASAAIAERLLHLKSLMRSCSPDELDTLSMSEASASPLGGDWMHRTRESKLVEFCQRTTLRAILLKERVTDSGTIPVANLSGLLVHENQEFANGIIVAEIGEDYVDLREGRVTRRISMTKPTRADLNKESK